MMSQMATFLLAGHETTASSMTWLLYELARHPEYQQKMRDEIRAIRARAAERGDADRRDRLAPTSEIGKQVKMRRDEIERNTYRSGEAYAVDWST